MTDSSPYMDVTEACQTGYNCHFLPIWAGKILNGKREPWCDWTIKMVSDVLFEFKFKILEPTKFMDKEVVIIRRVPARTTVNSWQSPVPEGPYTFE